MSNHLGKHFKSVRLERGFSLGDLARRIGYQNVNGACNRITLFERQGDIREDLLRKLAEALQIDWLTTVAELAEKDRREFFAEWNSWANEPVRPYVVLRLIAAVYRREELPEEIESLDEAEDAAAAIARKWKRRCCLVLSRRVSVWFDEQGLVECITEAVPGEPNSPYMKLGRGRKSFVLKTIGRDTMIQQVTWPAKSTIRRDQQGRDD